MMRPYQWISKERRVSRKMFSFRDNLQRFCRGCKFVTDPETDCQPGNCVIGKIRISITDYLETLKEKRRQG